MSGFPLTAWAVRHPRGSNADQVLRELGASADGESPDGGDVTAALLDELAPHCTAACDRWGASRVAVILGSSVPAADHPLAQLGRTLERVRESTGVVGPAYHVAAPGVGGAKALASAQRLLRASLADAAIVGGIDQDQGALLLVEKHGDAFVRVCGAAEATAGHTDFDPEAAKRVMTAAWDEIDRAALGYVHLHSGAHDSSFSSERAVASQLFAETPIGGTASLRMGTTTGALDVALAAASLARGYVPSPSAAELAHDRVLLHAHSAGGHHVALTFGTRS